MAYPVANNVQGTIQNNPLTNVGTNLVTDSATDTKLNALNAYPLFLALWDVNTNPNDTGNHMEIVKVTARASPNNYTITRGQQSTSGVQHNFGDNLALFWTKSNADDKQNQDGSTVYATDTGAANAYIVTLSPALPAYTTGFVLTFIPANNNTTSSTINVNGLGVKSITKSGANALDPADLVAGIPVRLGYDGTQFQLLGFTTRRNNYSASTNPSTGNDNTQGYQVGSVWINTTLNLVYICQNASTGAALWLSVSGKFGGTGADGALSISSGTTTLNLGGASYFVKNYSSISITGTGALTFSNPSANGCVVTLKSTGNVTLTSSATALIVGDALGASAGNHGISLSGKGPRSPVGVGSTFFQPGPTTETTYIAFVGSGAYVSSGPFSALGVFSGAGGGGSAVATTNKGADGAGGIGILIECGGALNFTGTISSVGQNGANGSGSASWGGGFFGYLPASGGGGNVDGSTASGSSSGNTGAGITLTNGGGGGGGGCVVILYNTLTANSGTITVTAGTGGTGTFSNGVGGGAGFSFVGANTEFA